MSSMNRKMFANRDARNKLAGMGGILSSSPELMNATQRFEPGGVVNPSASAPIATIGGRSFFLPQDGRVAIVDGEGNEVRDPSVLQAILQQTSGYEKPAMPMPEPERAGIMSTVAGLATASDNERPEVLRQRMNPSFRTPERTGLESFAQSQPVSEEVSNRMRVLAMAKAGASIKDMAQTTGRDVADIANIIAGSASLLATEGAALAADVAGLVASLVPGGEGASEFAFEGAQDLRDFGRNTYFEEGNTAPRLINTEKAPEVDRLAQIEAESLRNIGAGDEALFAEVAPVERLGENFPSSIIEARNTGTPQISNDPELASSQILGSQRSSFDAPAGETAPASSVRPDMPDQFSVSTGVPLTMEEVQLKTFAERLQAAEDGLGVPQQQSDRFPQEDQRLAEQEAQLFNLRNTQRSAQERMQMTMPEPAASNSDQTRVLDMARAGASIGEIARTVAAAPGTIANILAGSASLLVTEGGALAADVAGLVAGGGDASEFAFETAQDLRDFGRSTYNPSGNFFPRLINSEDPAEVEDPLDPANLTLRTYEGPSEVASANPVSADDPRLQEIMDGYENIDPSIVDAFNADADTGFAPVAPVAPAAQTNTDFPTNIELADQRMRESGAFDSPGMTDAGRDRLLEMVAEQAAASGAPDSSLRPRVRDPEAAAEAVAAAPPATPEGAAAALQEQVLEAEATTAPPADPEVAPPAADAPPMDINTDQLGADIDSDPANAGATASNAILGSAGVDTSGMGIEERTIAMRDMLDGLMGQTDAQEKEEFWMNMAMVGFGIAAGESSSAMKNIADGLLAGTAQISKGNAARSERNDRFTLTAFGEVLADQRAQEKFDRDVTLAGIRASGSGSIYGDRKDPLTAMYQLAQTMYAEGSFTTLAAAIDAARIQVEQDYGITLPRGGGSGGGGGLPVVTTSEEFAALPVGTQFTHLGQTRVKEAE